MKSNHNTGLLRFSMWYDTQLTSIFNFNVELMKSKVSQLLAITSKVKSFRILDVSQKGHEINTNINRLKEKRDQKALIDERTSSS
jgi:hypothetical protein